MKLFLDDLKLYKKSGKSVKVVMSEVDGQRFACVVQMENNGVIRLRLHRDGQDGSRSLLLEQTLDLRTGRLRQRTKDDCETEMALDT